MILDPSGSRGLQDSTKKDARYETGLFLLEGFQGLKELAFHHDLIVEVFATEAAVSARPELFADLPVEVTLVNDRVMDRISDTKTPQGL